MKRRLFTLAVIVFFFIMLLFPGPVFRGASQGILLWFQTVLPTLLPFMIAANLMVRTNAVHCISRLAGGLLGRALKVSDCGAFAVIAGFLCGYPMGAKVTADLLREGKICREEAAYLLSFCNNTSPMFIVSYVVMQNIGKQALFVPSVAILLLSPLLCSRVFYRIFRGRWAPGLDRRGKFKSPPGARSAPFSFDVLDACIMDSFDSITRVGGYIMLFSVFTELAFLLPGAGGSLSVCLFSFLEITAGVPMLAALQVSFPLRFLLVMALTSFGGFCASAQTYSMIQGTGLRISAYLTEKLATAGVTSCMCAVFLYVSERGLL